MHECRPLGSADVALVEQLIRESRTWALVDGLAASVVGPLAERCRELEDTLDRWARDDNFWARRSALLAHLLPLRRGGGDFERFGRYADGMLDERELFVRRRSAGPCGRLRESAPSSCSPGWSPARGARPG